MLTGPYSQNYFVLDFQHDTVYKCRVYNERDTQGNIILSGMWIIPIDKNMEKSYRKSSIRSRICINLDQKFPRLVLEVL